MSTRGKRSSVFAMMVLSLFLAYQPPALSEDKKPLPRKSGPAKITLGDNLATVDLPQGYAFLDKEIAGALLKENGSSDEGCLGMLIPDLKKGAEAKDAFFVVCRFEDIGYVDDKDAGKLDAKEILNTYKEGTKEQNEERKEQGLEPIYVGGWAEEPRYEKSKHQVVWALTVKEQDSDSAPVVTVNYNTRILGRRGVLSMNLVTDPDTLTDNKKKVSTLLAKTAFAKGSSYEEYVPGKDKNSGMGLTGLILGGGALAAAAKFGVLGGLWKWAVGLLLVGKKFIVLIIVGIGALISRLFTGKKKEYGP